MWERKDSLLRCLAQSSQESWRLYRCTSSDICDSYVMQPGAEVPKASNNLIQSKENNSAKLQGVGITMEAAITRRIAATRVAAIHFCLEANNSPKPPVSAIVIAILITHLTAMPPFIVQKISDVKG